MESAQWAALDQAIEARARLYKTAGIFSLLIIFYFSEVH
jgi:hypothetical protein